MIYFTGYFLKEWVKVLANISAEIIKMIERAKGIPSPVEKKSNLYTDLGFNSLSFVEFLLKIEETYSITFGITEMEMCLQVDQLIALVENKLRELEQS